MIAFHAFWPGGAAGLPFLGGAFALPYVGAVLAVFVRAAPRRGGSSPLCSPPCFCSHAASRLFLRPLGTELCRALLHPFFAFASFAVAPPPLSGDGSAREFLISAFSFRQRAARAFVALLLCRASRCLMVTPAAFALVA